MEAERVAKIHEQEMNKQKTRFSKLNTAYKSEVTYRTKVETDFRVSCRMIPHSPQFLINLHASLPSPLLSGHNAFIGQFCFPLG